MILGGEITLDFSLPNPLNVAKKAVTTTTKAVGDAGKAVGSTVTKAGKATVNAATEGVQQLGKGAQKAGSAAVDAAKGAVNVAKGAASSTARVATTAGKQVAGFGKGVGLGAWDAVKGVWSIVELSPQVGITKSLIQGKGLKGYEESLKQAGQGVKLLFTEPGKVWDAVKQPYTDDWGRGEYGSAVGRGVFEAVSLVVGAKGLDKVGKVGSASSKAGAAASKGSAAADAATAASSAGKAGKAGKAGSAGKAGASGKVTEAPPPSAAGRHRTTSTTDPHNTVPVAAARATEPGLRRIDRPFTLAHDSYRTPGGYQFNHRGVNVFVESSAKAPDAAVQMKAARARALIDNTPTSQIQELRQLNLLERGNPADAYWKRYYGNPNHLSAATGGRVQNRGSVNMYHTPQIEPTIGTFQHEMGHVIGHKGGPNQLDMWERAALRDQSHRADVARRGKLTSRDDHRELALDPSIRGVGAYADNELRLKDGYKFTEDFAESNRLALQSARNGAIATLRPNGLFGALRKKQLGFEQLFPNRAELLRGFDALRQRGIDPSSPAARGWLEQWGMMR